MFKKGLGSEGAIIGAFLIMFTTSLASYLLSEADKEKYDKIKQPCTPSGLMHRECKDVMSDKKMTNFEYLVFQDKLAKKQKEVAASSVFNEISDTAPADVRH